MVSNKTKRQQSGFGVRSKLVRLKGLIRVMLTSVTLITTACGSVQSNDVATYNPSVPPLTAPFTLNQTIPSTLQITPLSVTHTINPTASKSGNSQVPAPSAIPARWSANMGYDKTNGAVLVFGGVGRGLNPEMLNDTWLWKGQNWVQLHPKTTPLARSGATLAPDKTGRLILFGGDNGSGTTLAETWAWDGQDWKQLQPTHSPSARSGTAMVYDTAHQQLVLFGGEAPDPKGKISTKFDDTWAWDGQDWKQLQSTHSPSACTRAAMAYHAAQQQLILFGGDDNNGAVGDTWTWNGQDWLKLQLTNSPTPRSYAGFVYDSKLQQAVLFGGVGAGLAEGLDTWTWEGKTWTKQPTSGPSSTVNYPSAAYDETKQALVLLLSEGDKDKRHSISQTWFWIGTGWISALN